MSTPTTFSLSELTSAGRSAFKGLIATAPSIEIAELECRIREIAGSPKTAKIIEKSVEVPLFPELATRRDTAELTSRLLKEANREADPRFGHEMLFSWLALMFLPSLCDRTRAGHAKTRTPHAYIQTSSSTDSYRHLVACPYWLHSTFGSHARVFLAQKAFVHPDVAEQLISSASIRDSAAVVEVVDRLYWDDNQEKIKSNITAREDLGAPPPPGMVQKTPKPGTLHALVAVLGQIECTYDLRSMSANQIINKLPAEFLPWLESRPEA
jgi:hypothetical protein